jgi:hypothetical protein
MSDINNEDQQFPRTKRLTGHYRNIEKVNKSFLWGLWECSTYSATEGNHPQAANDNSLEAWKNRSIVLYYMARFFCVVTGG